MGLGTRETGRGNGDRGSGVLTMVVRQDLLYYIWATGYERKTGWSRFWGPGICGSGDHTSIWGLG